LEFGSGAFRIFVLTLFLGQTGIWNIGFCGERNLIREVLREKPSGQSENQQQIQPLAL